MFVITGPLHSQSSNIVLSDNAAYTATTAGDITTEQNESYGTAEVAAPRTKLGSSSHGDDYLEIID